MSRHHEETLGALEERDRALAEECARVLAELTEVACGYDGDLTLLEEELLALDELERVHVIAPPRGDALTMKG